MAHHFNAPLRTLLALAWWFGAASAMAANPLGFAVAAAPSMFVLAVAEAAPDSAEGKAVKAVEPRQPPPETPAPAARSSRQAAAQPVPEERDNDRKVSLR